MRCKVLFVAGLLAVLAAPPAVSAETLTDAAVVELVQAGLSAPAIQAKIRASANQFDVSTGALLWLKRQNVPDAVIAAMIDASASDMGATAAAYGGQSADPLAPHAAGIYLLEQRSSAPRMQRLDPTVASDVKTSSALGWILTYGVVPLKITTVLANPTAPFGADTDRPTFYFYFNQPGSGLYQNGLGMLRMPGPAPSPALFSLLHFQVAGGEREALTQQIGLTGSNNKAIDKSLVAFSYAELSPGVFKVTPDADLEPGEYAFVYTPTDQSDGEDGEARYFDFSTPTP
jgi:hypothetical protein